MVQAPKFMAQCFAFLLVFLYLSNVSTMLGARVTWLHTSASVRRLTQCRLEEGEERRDRKTNRMVLLFKSSAAAAAATADVPLKWQVGKP